MEELLSSLNQGQYAAVKNTEGPCLVIAGAGSGKTRVLTFRIAYLLSQGVPAHNILALTFTNKAAAEMKDRIAQIVGFDVAQSLNMGTFHSIFAKILRIEAGAIPGYDSNYTILDTDDVKKQIGQIIKNFGLDSEKDKYNPKKVMSIISSAKNELIPADMYRLSDFYKRDCMNGMSRVVDVFEAYDTACRASNSMDFDDLLLKTSILFARNPEILQKYHNRFQYILVDEYQDTNLCQYNIVKRLALPQNNLCVVGDDAQSIYSFRGARIENILNFGKDYKDLRTFRLEQNYRSTRTIVNAANSVIKKNKRQLKKQTFSELEEGEKINIIESTTDAEEGIKVASAIANMVERGENYSNFAILYRSNAQSRILEEALNKKRIPCKIVKGLSFFQRAEIKDVLAYVRVVINPRDEIALLRIINYPARAIGKTTQDKLIDVARANKVSLWEVLTRIEQTGDNFSPAVRKKISEFVQTILSFVADESTADAYSLMDRIVEKIGFKDALLKEYTTEEAQERFANVLELLNAAKEFVENELDPEAIFLHNYIEKIALLTDVDEEETEFPDRVLLMTVHAAKGLEFKHCFLVGLEEMLFPSMMNGEKPEEIEEERRLFYVALTRAMKTVTLSYAQTRRKYGSLQNASPSRFLSEIDEQYINGKVHRRSGYEQSNYGRQQFGSYSQRERSFQLYGGKPQQGFSSYGNSQRSSFDSFSQNAPKTAFGDYQKTQNQSFSHFGEQKPQPTLITPSNPDQIQEGMRVAHAKFGLGTVRDREGVDANASAIIAFDNWGEKKLLLKFAKLQIVEN